MGRFAQRRLQGQQAFEVALGPGDRQARRDAALAPPRRARPSARARGSAGWSGRPSAPARSAPARAAPPPPRSPCRSPRTSRAAPAIPGRTARTTAATQAACESSGDSGAIPEASCISRADPPHPRRPADQPRQRVEVAPRRAVLGEVLAHRLVEPQRRFARFDRDRLDRRRLAHPEHRRDRRVEVARRRLVGRRRSIRAARRRRRAARRGSR